MTTGSRVCTNCSLRARPPADVADELRRLGATAHAATTRRQAAYDLLPRGDDSQSAEKRRRFESEMESANDQLFGVALETRFRIAFIVYELGGLCPHCAHQSVEQEREQPAPALAAAAEVA